MKVLAETIHDVELYKPYKSKFYGYFEVDKIYNPKSKNPILKIHFCETGTTQEITFKQFQYGFATDPLCTAPNILGVGYTDGYDKGDYYGAWKIWIDILYRVFDEKHREYHRYGGIGLKLVNNNFVHFAEFLKYYQYRIYIGRPIVDYRDPDLYRQLTKMVPMVRMV